MFPACVACRNRGIVSAVGWVVKDDGICNLESMNDMCRVLTRRLVHDAAGKDYPLVMLSTFASLSVNSAKHLGASRERPFATLRVTRWAADRC